MTTDSEVRPGDKRSFEGVVSEVDIDGEACVNFSGGNCYVRMDRAELAASRLIRRAEPEIKVGDPVERKEGGSWRVVAIDGWSRLAWITPCVVGGPVDDEIVPLSDLTRIEGDPGNG